MSKTSQLICFFVLSYVHLCHGQLGSSPESDHYNVPNLMENMASRVVVTEDLKRVSSISGVLSIFNEFQILISNLYTNFKGALNIMGNSTKCGRDIKYLSDSLRDEDMWAIKMLDACGKPESGILDGNLKWLGNYHECTNIYVPPNETAIAGDFKGQYCTVESSMVIFNKVVSLTVGICIPDTCETELKTFKDTFLLTNPMPSVFNITKLTCHRTSRKFSSGDIGMIFLLSVFLALAAIGSGMTAFEYFYTVYITRNIHMNVDLKTDSQILADSGTQPSSRFSQANGLYVKLKPFFSCFCVFTNGEKILNTEGTESQFLCLHGIRFLSMAWVIVCHTYAFCIPPVSNLVETVGLIDVLPFQIIMNGSMSVDTFFLLSGFLLAYLFFKEYAKSDGKFPWVYFYIHRYIRLTPVYLICLGMYATLFYHMGSGPFWTTNEVEPICRDNWFYNILYINNFVPVAKQCFNWSWYLAIDMQLFIISPLFLITLWRWPTVGFSLIGLFASASFAANFGLTFHYKLSAGLENFAHFIGDPVFAAKQSMLFEMVYIKPYTRICPYLVGIALAYYLFKRKRNNQRKVNLITLCCGWIIAPVIALTCMFALYHRSVTTIEYSFYNSLRRTCFAGCVGWVIFTCLVGQGGPVDCILSFKPFIPLSRLTYSAYLIHPVIIYGYFGALKTSLYFSHMTMVTTFLGLLMITFVAAFLISVLFESPIINLDKLVRKKFKT